MAVKDANYGLESLKLRAKVNFFPMKMILSGICHSDEIATTLLSYTKPRAARIGFLDHNPNGFHKKQKHLGINLT